MAVNSFKFCYERPDVKGALWHFYLSYLFDGLDKTCRMGVRTYSAYALCKINILNVCPLLAGLLYPSMVITEPHAESNYLLSAQSDTETFRLFERRMLRPYRYYNFMSISHKCLSLLLIRFPNF